MRRIACWFAATALLAGTAAAQDGWVTVQQGNALIEIPQYFLDYATSPIIEDGRQVGINFEFEDEGSFLFYAVPRDVRPLERAGGAANDPTAEVTYEVDKDALGVVSGYYGENREVIFYSMCKGRGEELRCFALTYPSERRALFDPVVERLAASLE